jgi:glycosyltransferase involved in cell wall biosynthesis
MSRPIRSKGAQGTLPDGMPRVLHILPHPGGGGESVVDRLEQMAGGFEHRRSYLANARSPLLAAPSIAVGRPRIAHEAGTADLVHVIGDASAVLIAPLFRRGPSVFGTHGLHLLRRAAGPAGAVVRRRLRRVLATATVCVCTSEPERGELAALGGSARLQVVLNGVSLPAPVDAGLRESIRSELGLPAGTFAVLYAGELEPRKHPLTAAEAVLELHRAGEPAVLLLAGDGPLRPRIEQLPPDVVRVLGFRDDADRLMAAADAFVMPSEREGLSLAVLEAMGHGLPVVVSDGAGNPEAVGDAGVTSPLGDVPALAAALRRLAGDPAERARLGAAGRERVSTKFSIERYLEDMRRVFTEALEAG